MSRVTRALGLGIVAVAALWLLGCPEAAVETDTATVSVSADLAPAFASGVSVEAVSVSLANDQSSFTFDLTVDTGAETASGSQTDVPVGDYAASIVVEDASGVVGQASSSLSVREDTTITVVIEITTTDDGDTGGSDGGGSDDTDTGGSITVGLE